MIAQAQIAEALSSWAALRAIQLVWKNETLRLEITGGHAGSFVEFDPKFWETFAGATSEMQEHALRSITLAVELEYRDENAQLAYPIVIPLTCVLADNKV